MNEFLNPPVIWFIVGFAFLMLEFVIPGFILFFFGVGAWIVAVLTLFLDISIDVQIFVFIGASLLSVLFFRKWLRAKFGDYGERKEVLEDEYVGKFAIAETSFGPGTRGKVNFKGASWDAESDDAIQPGETVLISATKSILLIVKSNK